MLVVAILDGFSSSSRPGIRETSYTILRKNHLIPNPIFFKKSMLGFYRSKQCKKFIKKWDYSANQLLCIGKSLGAKHMVTRVLNQTTKLSYSKVALVTIDPCWPLINDWTPNLNDVNLYCSYPVGLALNIHCIGSKRDQCGAALRVKNGAINYPIMDSDHFSIVNHIKVKECLQEAIDWLKE